ncbi:MAG: transposase [Myxococcales bacterium]|nr:transposase [Myxococcales bacterium]
MRGINLHAAQVIDGRDRRRVERLAKYITRPPIAQDRLERRQDGRLELIFKKVWRDGTRALVLEPHDLIARLVAAVPPPRFHMLRYFGVLSSHSSRRALVVPKPPVDAACHKPPPARGDQPRAARREGRCAGRAEAVGVVAGARVRGRCRDVPALLRPDEVGGGRHEPRGHHAADCGARGRPRIESAAHGESPRPRARAIGDGVRGGVRRPATSLGRRCVSRALGEGDRARQRTRRAQSAPGEPNRRRGSGCGR